jgi:GLPGLI family protein
MRSKLILAIIFLLFVTELRAQITAGKISYERKINLYKKFKDADWDFKTWIKEQDKLKVDSFELFFNDTLSAFKPIESELKENLGWATNKNSVFHDFKTGSRYNIKRIWGEEVHVMDTLYKRKWKITDSKRIICGYTCRKAVWNVNDSTRVYAWYCNEIIPSVGPESFYGLPGAILGLASEDGGVIYFAKTVEAKKPELAILVPPKTKKKIYSSAELKKDLEQQYGDEKWGKTMIKNVFSYW